MSDIDTNKAFTPIKSTKKPMLIISLALLLAILSVATVTLTKVYKSFKSDQGNIRRYTSLKLFDEEYSITEKSLKESKNKAHQLLADYAAKELSLLADKDINTLDTKTLGVSINYNKVYSELSKLTYSTNVLEYLSQKRSPLSKVVHLNSYINFNKKTLEKYITKKLAPKYNTEPIDARLKLGGGGNGFFTTPSSEGRKINQPSLVKSIKSALDNNDFKNINIPFITLKPKYTEGQVQNMTPLYTLSTFSTEYGFSSPQRKTNIGIASSNINNYLLAPGEDFEFYKGIGGEPTKARGFQEAPVYVNGRVDSGIGGGMCQVSTTLYNAVLEANLQPLERYSHVFPVHYIPMGLDAAVAYGCNTLKFRNNTKGYLWIKSYHDGNTLSFTIIGHDKLDKKISIYSKPRGALSVDVYRDIYDMNGKLLKHEYLHRSTYKQPN